MAGITILWFTELIGIEDPGDVLFVQPVLSLALIEVVGGVDTVSRR